MPHVGHQPLTFQGEAPYLCDPSWLQVAMLGIGFWWDHVSASTTYINVALLYFVAKEWLD